MSNFLKKVVRLFCADKDLILFISITLFSMMAALIRGASKVIFESHIVVCNTTKVHKNPVFFLKVEFHSSKIQKVSMLNNIFGSLLFKTTCGKVRERLSPGLFSKRLTLGKISLQKQVDACWQISCTN